MDIELLTALAIIAVYLCVAVWLVVLARRLSRGLSNLLLRIIAPAAVASLLLAPTFAACGAAAPVPFPFLLVIDIISLFAPVKEVSCGYQTPFNILIVLASFILVVLASLVVALVRSAIRRKTPTQS